MSRVLTVVAAFTWPARRLRWCVSATHRLGESAEQPLLVVSLSSPAAGLAGAAAVALVLLLYCATPLPDDESVVCLLMTACMDAWVVCGCACCAIPSQSINWQGEEFVEIAFVNIGSFGGGRIRTDQVGAKGRQTTVLRCSSFLLP